MNAAILVKRQSCEQLIEFKIIELGKHFLIEQSRIDGMRGKAAAQLALDVAEGGFAHLRRYLGELDNLEKEAHVAAEKAKHVHVQSSHSWAASEHSFQSEDSGSSTKKPPGAFGKLLPTFSLLKKPEARAAAGTELHAASVTFHSVAPGSSNSGTGQ